jgi:hypothetical protein
MRDLVTRKAALMVAAAIAVGSPGAPLAQTEQAQPNLKSLLTEGYEIKATMFIPSEVVQRSGATVGVDAVIITLQKGASMATCYPDYVSFVTGSFFTAICTKLE